MSSTLVVTIISSTAIIFRLFEFVLSADLDRREDVDVVRGCCLGGSHRGKVKE